VQIAVFLGVRDSCAKRIVPDTFQNAKITAAAAAAAAAAA
jgi:hypothetical protein